MSLFLQQIKLTNYKNYDFATFDCAAKVNAIVGRNGMGKTNLLDAIYYLCICKSYHSPQDRYNVQKGQDFFRLEGHFKRKAKKEKVVAKVIPAKLKEMEFAGKTIDKFSDHIGRFPVVIVTPDDTQLAFEASDSRRKFMDNAIGQIDKSYLQALIDYNKVLKQRNALLKQFQETGQLDQDLLQIYTAQLIPYGKQISAKRAAFILALSAFFTTLYDQISNQQETVALKYKSKLIDSDFEQLLTESIEKDKILGRTTIGIHRDDIAFIIKEGAVKRFASQGQLKSFILALKLAQYRLMTQDIGLKPILLLDDIFDKLDQTRIRQLIKLIFDENIGQVFLTDTDEARLPELIKGHIDDFNIFKIENGKAVD